ncbi:MAG: S8 family serine peptidase [Candidatus Competibacterales bacterium]
MKSLPFTPNPWLVILSLAAALLLSPMARAADAFIVELDLDALAPEVAPYGERLARAQERLLAMAELGTIPSQRFRHLPLLAVRVTPAQAQALAGRQGVLALHPDRLFRPQLAETTFQIGALSSQTQGFDGAGWTVAVLDTGVDGDHPFVAGAIVAEACFSSPSRRAWFGPSSLCPDASEQQLGPGAGAACPATVAGCDHGTHVAGIAAGYGGAAGVDFSGVAPGASLMAIQVFSELRGWDCYHQGLASPCALAYTSDIVAALEYVYDQRDTLAIAAVNLSLGGGSYGEPCPGTPEAAAIELLTTAGIAVVAAAGNGGDATGIASPACAPGALAVGAVDNADLVAEFSNAGTPLDLWAPGVEVTSSIPGDGYGAFSGTSMAAPHVAGAVAVLRSAYPEADLATLTEALLAGGVAVTDPRSGLTFPRLQVDGALEALAITAP